MTRHFDHIQSLPYLAAAISQTLSPVHVAIDADNVPLVEIKPDVKVKKPKADAAAAAPVDQAAKPVKQVNVDKVVSDKKKGEQKAAAAAAAEGAKPEGKKKEKAPKEKKPAAPAPVAEAPAPWMIDLRVGKIVDGERRALAFVADAASGHPC